MVNSEDVLIIFKGEDQVSNVTGSISSTISQLSNNSSNSFNNAYNKISFITGALSGVNSTILGLIGNVTGKSLSTLIFGGSEKAEVNKVLLNGMADTESGVESLYNTIDSETNKGLMSMQSVIPALKSFQAETGLTGKNLESIVPDFVQFGSYMYAMTGSSEMAATALTKLSNGLYGASQYLTRYGFSEEALKSHGWSGESDDVTGYFKAVNSIMGDTDALMDTTTGIVATLQKKFSIAGKSIGKEILPVIKGVAKAFIGLNDLSGGNLAKAFIIIASSVSVLSSALGAFGVAMNGVQSIMNIFSILTNSSTASNIANAASSRLVTASEIEEAATKLGISAATAEEMAAKEGLIVVTEAEKDSAIEATGANMGFMASLSAIIVPALIVAAVIALIIGVSYEIGKSFGYWNNFNEMISSIQSGLIRLWNAFTGSSAVKSTINTLSKGFTTLKNMVIDSGTIINDIFSNVFGGMDSGDPVGQIIKNFGSLTPAIETIESSFNSAFSSINSYLASVMSNWNAFKNSTEGKELFSSLQEAFKGLGEAWNTFQPALNAMGVALNDLWSALTPGGGGFDAASIPITLLVAILKGAVIVINGVSIAIRALSTVIGIVAGSIIVLVTIARFISTALGNVRNSVINAGNSLKQFPGFLANLPSRISSFIMQILSHFNKFASQVSMKAKLAGKNLLNGLINSIKTAPMKIWVWLLKIIKRIGIFGVQSMVRSRIAGRNIINGIINTIKSLPSRVSNILANIIGRILNFAGQALSSASTIGRNITNGVVNNIKSLPGMVYNEFMQIGTRMMSAGSSLYNKAKTIASQIVSNFMSGLDAHSPGKIQRTVACEFAMLPYRMMENADKAYNASRTYAKGIVDSFGKPVLHVDSQVDFNHNNIKGLDDYNRYMQYKLKDTSRNMNLISGGVQAVGGTSITNKHLHFGEGSMKVDARNMSMKEAQQVVIGALEQWK
jgi:hypothetical protein